MTPGRNRTRAAFVGGERFHPYAIPAIYRIIFVKRLPASRQYNSVGGKKDNYIMMKKLHTNIDSKHVCLSNKKYVK